MSWQQIYLNYDENTLALYANVGIIRRARKDLDNHKVQLVEQLPNYFKFDVDGQTVVLSDKGIQAAHCDCRASECCKHIIGAILLLQRNFEIAIGSEIETENNNDKHAANSDYKNQSNSNALHELLSLNPAELLKTCGLTNRRLAYQLMLSWQDNHACIVQDKGTQLQVMIPESVEPIIYLVGLGFDGMISTLPVKQKIATHLAIIAYLFAENKQQWDWGEVVATNKPIMDKLTSEEISLINDIDQHICQLITQGLSHVSHNQATQFQLLNMTAKAVRLPRLSATLRQLCQLVAQLADKLIAIDEQQLLFFLAQTKAYLEMLLQHKGESLSLLRGGERIDYQKQDNQTLALIPLGANWWVNHSGSMGATFYFWDRVQLTYLTSTVARPHAQDIHFTRQSVWEQATIWRTAPTLFMHKSLTLSNPRLAGSKNLASTGSTVTISDQSWDFNDYLSFRHHSGFSHWPALSEYLKNDQLDSPVLNDVLFIHINKIAQPYWDEIRQCLVWPVMDEKENLLFLRLFWHKQTERRIAALEQFLHTKIQPLTLLVKPSLQDYYLDLAPFVILYQDPETKKVKPFSLDFESLPYYFNQKMSQFLPKNISHFARKKNITTHFAINDPIITNIIQPIMNLLDNCTCRGITILSSEDKTQLRRLQYDCDSLGLTLLSQTLNKLNGDGPIKVNHILQVAYLCYVIKKKQFQLPIELVDG